MILSICDTPKVMKVMNIVVSIIDIIKIVVPIILLFSLIFKFIKASTKGDEDAIASIKKKAVPSIIAAALIFLVPTIINLIIVFGASDSDIAKCLKKTSEEDIQEIYIQKMEKLLSAAVESEDINDYINAKIYLINIEDEELVIKYIEILDEVKEKIDDRRKIVDVYGENTSYGSEITPTPYIIESCKWVLHPDDIQIRLQTCTDEHQYKNPNEALPGGAIATMTNGVVNYVAKETIPYSQYELGLFAGEIDFRFNATFNRMFAIMYKQVILNSVVRRYAKRGETTDYTKEYIYTAGSCAQNYRQNILESRYFSGRYTDIIDEAVNSTKYLLLVDKSKGDLTEVRYNTRSGILPVMDNASKKSDIEGILEAMKSGHDLAFRYKDAVLYDCRNLLTDEDIAIESARMKAQTNN